MNTNPLMPGGAQQKNQGRARVKIAVFFVLAVHVVVLGALLMQGCKKEESQQSGDTNTPTLLDSNAPVAFADTNPPPLPPPVAPTNALPIIPDTTSIDSTIIPTAPGGMTEYRIAKGDSFDKLAKKFQVSVKAIQEANPGVVPTKLQIGQKINIPAPSTSATTAASTLSGTSVESSSFVVHEVKSGDTLWGLARKYGVKESALRDANNLKVGSTLKVGQKLRIPASATPPAPIEPAPSTPSPAPSSPAPAGTTPIR
jgi:LysM repeat protein